MRTLRSAIGIWTLIAVVAVALLVRGLFLASDTHPYDLAGLSASEGEVARNIVNGSGWFVVNPDALAAVQELQNETRKLVDPETFDYSKLDANLERKPELVEPLGPAVLLAGIWKVTGDQRYIWLQVLQIGVGAAMTVVVAWLSLVLFGRRRPAIIAALLWAVSPGIAYFATIPLYEIWAVYATVGIFAFYLWARLRGSPLWALIAIGLLIAAATTFRQGLILLPFALAAAEIRVSFRAALKTLAVIGAACLIGLIPWTIRSLSEFDQPRPFNGVSGQVLWQGLGDDTETFGAVNDDAKTFDQVHAIRPDLEYGTAPYDDFLRENAIDAILDHPLAYLRVIALRVGEATVANPSPWKMGIDNVNREDGDPLRWVVTGIESRVQFQIKSLLDGALFLIALVTSVVLWRRRDERSRQGLLYLWAIYISVLVIPVLVSGREWRYVAPGLFALFIVAALGLDEVWVRFRAWRARGGGWEALLIGAAGAGTAVVGSGFPATARPGEIHPPQPMLGRILPAIDRARSPAQVVALGGLAAGLVVSPLAFPFLRAGEPALITFDRLWIPALFAACLYVGWRTLPRSREPSFFLGAFALFAVAYGIRAAATGGDELTALRTWVDAIVFPLLLFVIATWAVKRISDYRYLLGAFAISGVVLALIGIFLFVFDQQLATRSGGTPVYDAAIDLVRTSGPFSEPEPYALALLLTYTATLCWIQLAGRPSYGLGGTAAALQLIAVGLTFFRVAWIAAIVITFLAIGLRTQRSRRIATIVGCAAVAAAVVALLVSDTISERVSNSQNVVGRVATWAQGMRVFAKAPAFGVGIERYETRVDDETNVVVGDVDALDSPHSSYVGVLAEQGVVGFIAFGTLTFAVWWLLRAFRRAAREREDVLLSRCVVGAAVAYLICSLTLEMLVFGPPNGLFAVLLGTIAGRLSALQERVDSVHSEDRPAVDSDSGLAASERR